MRDKLIALAAVFTLVFTAAGAMAAEEFGFFRYPDAKGDKVVFTSEGDLWIASINGGTARRLTTDDGVERFPKFSPDGKLIAYSAEYDGNMDVYIIPVEGGEPKRLTYHPYGDAVVDWTPDGKIIYRSARDTGQRLTRLYTVDKEGNYSELMALPKAAMASFAADGNRIAFTPILRNNATWKHYQGGLADQIWVADLKKKEYGKKQVSTYIGHNSYPMWIGERIYFISDSIGRQNIWSMKPDGSDQKKLSDQKKYDIRWPSAGDNVIVYQLAMDIWKTDIATGKSEKIDIQLPSERLGTRQSIMEPSGFINWFDLDEKGDWMVIEARGQLFSVPTKSRTALVRTMTSDFSVRTKHPSFLGNKVIALSDATGEDEFWQYDPFLKEAPKKLSSDNKMWRYHLQVSPDKKSVAYSDGNCNLYIMDVASGKSTKVAHSDIWEIRSYQWSPDSRYLAYVSHVTDLIDGIYIYDTQTKEDHYVTDPMYSSYHPSWDPKGKYLYFLTESYINPMPNRYWDQIGYITPDKLYMYLLNDEAKSPFAPDSSLLGMKEEEKKDEKKDEKKEEDKDKGKEEEAKEDTLKVEIKWEGLQSRMVEVPVSAGYYYALAAAEDMLYFVSGDRMGMTPDEEEGPKPSLKLYKFGDRKEYTVMEGIDSFDLSDNGKVLVVQQGSSFIRMDAGATEAPTGTGDDDPHVKLDGWSVKHNPRAEWGQMFREAWRIQRDFFYDEKMHGVDWEAVLKLYEPLIPRIATREDLNDLIGEMIGELNAGHAYIFGGDMYRPKRISVGMLGADVSRDKSGYFRIDRILAPDLTAEDTRSPLTAPHIKVKAGDYIIAIDGISTTTVKDYMELLQNKAGREVILTLNSKPSPDSAVDYLVKTMSDEFELRYRDWVEGRRKYVEEKSGGKIGYIHMSDMSVNGLKEYGRMYYPQYNKPGMVLDVRDNGGGNIAIMLLSHLDRRVWSTETARRTKPSVRPSAAFFGHYAILCNNETGSDGETFTQGAQMLGLGKIFGTRTWGGWVGIRSDKPLNDQAWYTTPEFSGWGVFGDKEGKWLIEGTGVYPDVEIENDPGSVLAGKDPQLDAAIAYLLDKMAKEPKTLPARPPVPKKKVNLPK